MRKFIIIISVVSLLASCTNKQSDSFTVGKEITEAEMNEKLSALSLTTQYTALKVVEDSYDDFGSYQMTWIMDMNAHYYLWQFGSKSIFSSHNYYHYDYIENGIYYRAESHPGNTDHPERYQNYTRFIENPFEEWHSYCDNRINGFLDFVNGFPTVLLSNILYYTEAPSKTFRYDSKTESLSVVIEKDEFVNYSFLVRGNQVIRNRHGYYATGYKAYQDHKFIYDGFTFQYPDLTQFTEWENYYIF